MGKIVKNKIEYTGSGISKEELDKKAERSIYADDSINIDTTDWHIAIGYETTASPYGSAAIGQYSSAEYNSYAIGVSAIASEAYAYSLGTETKATGRYSTAMGQATTASGNTSYAEGNKTIASGNASHAEGNETQAIGYASHSEGYKTIAKASYSHAEGFNTIASGLHQHVKGKFNIEDTMDKYVEIVGNGTAPAPSNAYTLDWGGNAWFAGEVTNALGKGLSTNDFTNELKEKLENMESSGGGSVSITVDSELSTTSTNPVENMVITQKINEMDETIQSLNVEVDSELSTTSTNPVQNKVITQKLNEVFQSVSSGKSLIASAITDKGVITRSDATFETMADNISQIVQGDVTINGYNIVGKNIVTIGIIEEVTE